MSGPSSGPSNTPPAPGPKKGPRISLGHSHAAHGPSEPKAPRPANAIATKIQEVWGKLGWWKVTTPIAAVLGTWVSCEACDYAQGCQKLDKMQDEINEPIPSAAEEEKGLGECIPQTIEVPFEFTIGDWTRREIDVLLATREVQDNCNNDCTVSGAGANLNNAKHSGGPEWIIPVTVKLACENVPDAKSAKGKAFVNVGVEGTPQIVEVEMTIKAGK